MRRLLSIALMLLMTMPAFASLWVGAQQQAVPICCRRAGAHHCMEMGAAVSGEAVVRSACPMLIRTQATAQTGSADTIERQTLGVEKLTQPAIAGQVEAGFRIAAGRAWHKRGPPHHNS